MWMNFLVTSCVTTVFSWFSCVKTSVALYILSRLLAVAHALEFSVFTSRNLATDLSQSHFLLQLTHEVFLAQS
jgi:hypothetical protein